MTTATATHQTLKSLKHLYWLNLALAIDQLGNALAGGSADSTVSARVGFYSYEKYRNRWLRLYWHGLRWLIDFAFYPIDGPEHCRQAYASDADELFVHGSDLALAALGMLVLIMAPILGVIIRLSLAIKWLVTTAMKAIASAGKWLIRKLF